MAGLRAVALSVVVTLSSATRAERNAAWSEGIEPSSQAYGRMRLDGWAATAAPDDGVPAHLFARAITSLAPHYHHNYEALQAHLQLEHSVSLEDRPHVASAHLCCTDYAYGREAKAALEAACGGTSFVRTAFNSRPHGTYCALAHMSPASSFAEASAAVHWALRCSPMTHAAKEPASLLAPAAAGEEDAHFGLRLGASLPDGAKRGLVVTMSPGSFPLGPSKGRVRAGGASAGTRGGARNRKLFAADTGEHLSARDALEGRWRRRWSNGFGVEELLDTVPWTRFHTANSPDGSKRDLLAASNDHRSTLAQGFHSQKARGYREAFEHLRESMGSVDGRTLSEKCGWDTRVSFVHGRNDVLRLRNIHHEDHDDRTATACFLGLVGFLSAQPEVMHIHPEARPEATNKVLTAYMEGGEAEDTPMRLAGLDGEGQIIGVTDTGLDESSCFFRDDDYGLVPRTSMENAYSYPDRRKVVQYVSYADERDGAGHGTHVAGVAAGKIYDDWRDVWVLRVSEELCEEEDSIMSCLGTCVGGLAADECHWNPELACPMSDCDDDRSCDDETGYIFPCFGDPEEELPAAAGMAPEAKIAFFDIGVGESEITIPDDIGDMWDAQYAAGARIMTNSWSLVTMTEPSSRDVDLDEWIHANPDAFVVFAAGNGGFTDGGINRSSVQSPATAKTAMTVGASNSGPDRAYAYYSDAISSYSGVLWPEDDVSFEVSPYSSRGPVGDFTLKPEVVAPGLMVHSAKASLSDDDIETCALEGMGGTSMSAPAVAGAAALVRQYFSSGVLATYLDDERSCTEDSVYVEAGLCEAFEPTGYLIKAVLVNSAAWLGNMQTVSYENTTQWMEVLDFAQGFGAVQMASALPTAESPVGAFFHEHELESESHYYYLVYVEDPSTDLSVTVAWYDPPSTVASYNLLHDLDTFVMAIDTRSYFRSNSYSTIESMCGEDEDCAQKYGFTFSTNLADYMNPTERVVVSSSDLTEGYYAIGVRARTLTESDTQTYGLAATGAGMVLHDMASVWSHLGLETSSVEEPDPEEEEQGLVTQSPAPAVTASPTFLSSASSSGGAGGGDDLVIAAPGTPSPTEESMEGAETAVTSSVDGGDDFYSSSRSSSSISGSLSSSISSSSNSSASHSDGTGEGSEPQAASNDGSGDDVGLLASRSRVAIVASATGAAMLIGVGLCLAWRRRRRGVTGKGKDETGTFLDLPAASSRAAVAEPEGVDGHLPWEEGDCQDRASDGEGRISSISAYLPGYDTAVASMSEESGAMVVRTSSGGEKLVQLGDGGESEVSGFYAAVDPHAVSKLVGWGISRDFAKVALRQTDNDVPAALRMIAEGNMDEMLAMDNEEMAQEGMAVAAAVGEGSTAAASDSEDGATTDSDNGDPPGADGELGSPSSGAVPGPGELDTAALPAYAAADELSEA